MNANATPGSIPGRRGARVYVGLLVAALQCLGFGCSSQGCGAQLKGDSTMQSSLAEDVLARLEKTGTLGGAEIEHYIGGGMPGPALHNDQLRFFTRNGIEVMEFAKSNFKRTEFTPYALDIYSLPAEPAVVKKIARLVRETRAYRDDFPEETPHDIADKIHLELEITEGGKTAARSYPGGPPASFALLEAEVETLIDRLKATGEYGLYDGKVKIAGAVRP